MNQHRYFIAWPDSQAPLLELPGPSWTSDLEPEVRYPLAVLAEAEKSTLLHGLHFYLTKDPDHLPEYGSHVVAVLLQEERCKTPQYGRHVRAVIRNLQTFPFLGFRAHPGLGRLEVVETLEYIRDWALHLRSRSRMRRFQLEGVPAINNKPRIVTIPLGYHSQQELPILPMDMRSLDSFFSGDVRSSFLRNDYRYWISTSKVEARRQLWDTLQQLQGMNPGAGWKIPTNEMDAHGALRDATAYGNYSERMQQSRICLAPRGSVAETFRMFEGFRAGCLVMTNRLPDMPFLSGAPVVFVDNWNDLPKLLRKYARDFAALEEYGKAGRAWWDEHCSERAIGEMIATRLNELG